MRRSLLVLALVAIAATALWAFRAVAQDATPGAASGTTTLVLVEHNDQTTTLNLGEPGNSAGDILVWGPNPLFDESNTTDTGAVTQGSCIALNAEFDCELTETIVFPDGSTLEFQGVELGNAQPSLRTIVGGSGQYLGAVGTAQVTPSDDFALWTRVIEVTVP